MPVPRRLPDQKIRVFLLDSHEICRRGLRTMLDERPDIEVVGEASGVAEGLALISAVRPDIVVLDLWLVDGSGVDVCRQLRLGWPDTKLFVVAGRDEEETFFEAIRAGVDAYTLRTIAGEELVSGLRSVARGESLIDPRLTSRMLDHLRHGDERPPEPVRPSVPLTPREEQVLRLLGEGMTNRQIASRMYLGETSVKNCVSSVFVKLGVERRTQAAVLAARYRR